MNQLPQSTITELIRKASEVREQAHAPYSHFHVGSALLGAEGKIFTGCNVEFSSYSLTCCAERNALYHAVSCGIKDFIAVAIVSVTQECPPCGACRQALADFNPDMTIIQADVNGKYTLVSLREIFPKPFAHTHIDDGRNPG